MAILKLSHLLSRCFSFPWLRSPSFSLISLFFFLVMIFLLHWFWLNFPVVFLCLIWSSFNCLNPILDRVLMRPPSIFKYAAIILLKNGFRLHLIRLIGHKLLISFSFFYLWMEAEIWSDANSIPKVTLLCLKPLREPFDGAPGAVAI